MTIESMAGKIILITLAILGALFVLSMVGMLFMHSSMMGGSPMHGFMSSIARMCGGMMGRLAFE
jgi:hypothetical protein